MVDECIGEDVVVSSELGQRQPLLLGRCPGSLGGRHVNPGEMCPRNMSQAENPNQKATESREIMRGFLSVGDSYSGGFKERTERLHDSLITLVPTARLSAAATDETHDKGRFRKSLLNFLNLLLLEALLR